MFAFLFLTLDGRGAKKKDERWRRRPRGKDTRAEKYEFENLVSFYLLFFSATHFSIGLKASQALRKVHLHWWHRLLGYTSYGCAENEVQVYL